MNHSAEPTGAAAVIKPSLLHSSCDEKAENTTYGPVSESVICVYAFLTVHPPSQSPSPDPSSPVICSAEKKTREQSSLTPVGGAAAEGQ